MRHAPDRSQRECRRAKPAGTPTGTGSLRLAAGCLVLAAAPSLAAAQGALELPPSVLDPRGCGPTLVLGPGQPYRLVDVIRAVVCQNPALRQGAGLSRQAEAALLRARAAWQPAVSASLRVGSADSDPATAEAGVRLEWLLYDFGSARSTLAQSQLAARALLGDQAAQALSAVAQAAQLHASALAAASRHEAALANLRIAEDSARLAEARQSAGAATLGDRLQAQTALAQARLDQTRALTQWLTARGALAVAMGLPAQLPLTLAGTESVELLERDAPLDLAALAAQARAEHPRVVAARVRLAESRHRSEGLKAERWGTVTLNASASRARALRDGTPANDASASVGWSIPLLDRGVLQSQQMDAQGQIQVREVALDDAERQVELGVWQEGQVLLGQRRTARASREVFETAQHSLRAASERYRLGAGSFADLLNAQGAAASARLQLAESQAGLLQAHLRLAAAVGRFGPGFSIAAEVAR